MNKLLALIVLMTLLSGCFVYRRQGHSDSYGCQRRNIFGQCIRGGHDGYYNRDSDRGGRGHQDRDRW